MKITQNMPLEIKKHIQPVADSFKKLDSADELRDAQLRKKSKELEAVFLTQLIKSMEKTIPEGMGGGKNSLSTMMFSSVMGDAMSQGGGIGLSQMIFTSLKGMEKSSDMPEFSGNDYLKTLDVLQNIKSTNEEI